MNDKPTKTASPAANIRQPTDLYYLPGQWYSFTICPSDQLETSPNRWERMCDRINECVLSGLSQLASYRFNIEISEPHDTVKSPAVCRIHAHGRFLLHDTQSVLQFLLFGLRNLSQLGIMEIDKISDLGIWDTYCEKQQAITKYRTVSKARTEPPSKRVQLKAYDQPKNRKKLEFWQPPPVQYQTKEDSDTSD